MVQFNFGERTIKAKVVYYGPPQSGKTTNLEQIHRLTDPDGANRLISLNTAQDRTLFFDLLPFSLGSVSGYDFKVQLYTVPGQVQYNATRRVVLAGADAVVFVADGQKSMARENVSALENMKVNLLANRLVPEKVPLVFQYNKQDLPDLLSPAELDRTLNFWERRTFPAVASRGEGVMDTFIAVVQEMLGAIAVKYNLREKGLDPEAVPEIVTRAFEALLQKASSPSPEAPPPGRVIVAHADDAEAAPPQPPGPASSEADHLLHRAIRSNAELAETLGQLVRELTLGIRTIRTEAEALATGDEASRLRGEAIRHEADRLQRLLSELGRSTKPSPAAEEPPPAPLPSPAAPPAKSPAAQPVPRPAPAPPAVAASTVPPAPVRPAAVQVAATLDALLAEVATAQRAILGARGVTLENRVARGTPLPRCSPAALRRALAAFVQGLAVLVAPASAIAVRTERKPVLMRGRDGGEVKRDFVMIAFTHAGGLDEAGQQQVQKGSDTGVLGEGQRSVRELGGFIRFAPLPGGALETRLFLPA